jgi:ssRNA-specific RNase YbeY (16S rRNA maturation enzyme)
MLHLMGFDHETLDFPFQGVPQRLTNITKTGTKIIKRLIA